MSIEETNPLHHVHNSIRRLYATVHETEAEFASQLSAIPDDWQESARNLIHYLGLRGHDIRPLQIELGHLGLSSLGRLEAHVTAGLESVIHALEQMADLPPDDAVDYPKSTDFRAGDNILHNHATALFGPPCSDRQVRIMVTMPSEAADDYRLVCELMKAGMNVMRINSAHDDVAAWEQMVQHARRAETELNQSCRILFDLCGPKLRTGPIEPGPAILRLRAQRDKRGIVHTPTLAWIGSEPPPPDVADITGVIPVDAAFVRQFQDGDVIVFRDIPGRTRRMRVTRVQPTGAVVESRKSAYIEPGLMLNLHRNDRVVASTAVGSLPQLESSLRLQTGDTLILTSGGQPGRPAYTLNDAVEPATIPCTLPEVFRHVQPGEPVHLDDGKFSGIVKDVSIDAIRILINRAPPGGAKLRADKGINLPETKMDLPALSPDDLDNLAFAAKHVDMVGLSFVADPADLYHLHSQLEMHCDRTLGVILKIENRQAFENLPSLLLAGLRKPPFGVMVARGDLGVEVGFERLAEVQEQILWLCEAAHVPVIWATQVLESLAKSGTPSRAEVTDAAMSARAECVMLNKGPYVVETVKFLNGVLERMRDHHHKKTPMLRKLKVSEGRFTHQSEA